MAKRLNVLALVFALLFGGVGCAHNSAQEGVFKLPDDWTGNFNGKE